MSDHIDMLAPLLALKRQKQEQEMWAAQQAVRTLERELAQAERRLRALNDTSGPCDGQTLSARDVHIARLLADLARVRGALEQGRAAQAAARDALAKTLLSEQQIVEQNRRLTR